MNAVSYRDLNGTAAENYQRHFVPAIAMPVSATLLDAADLRPGERVLDVACGTGVIARLAAERVGATGSVTAVDLAPEMIEVATTTPAPAEPVIEWRVADATALPLPDDAYGAVLCQMGLMFMSDRDAAVAEMRRVAAPGGRVVVNVPGRPHPLFEIMERGLLEHIEPDFAGFVGTVFSMHDPDALTALLRGNGLRDVTAAVARPMLRLPAPEEFLWQYINLTPLGSLVAQAPEAAKAAFERDVVAAWRPFVLTDGRMAAEQPIVVASGRV